ncbi:hypothetical protein F8M41_022452 [Gigaspora margarita]|uniref:Uncharacterized protein n=1 Tax=Gigaspora margarita TaxID=4874 RepID=A0A8H4AEY9_GIGMA|nr:hypothetical protein F8M41_022452 [Gigaspora margarita]
MMKILRNPQLMSMILKFIFYPLFSLVFLLSQLSHTLILQDDGRQLRNWPIPPQYSVITPAKCLIKSGRCYVYVIIHSESDGISSDKVIWFWKDRKKSLDGSLQTKKKIREFERDLFSLEISPLLPKNVILINKDGSLLIVLIVLIV